MVGADVQICFYVIFFQKKAVKICGFKKCSYLCIAFEKERALSSAGSERLPYKQRVGGSNPSAPTVKTTMSSAIWWFFVYYKIRPRCG